jgi:hypothetical protein
MHASIHPCTLQISTDQPTKPSIHVRFPNEQLWILLVNLDTAFCDLLHHWLRVRLLEICVRRARGGRINQARQILWWASY